MGKTALIISIILATAACACIMPDDSGPEIPTPAGTPTPEMPQSIADMIPGDNLPGTFKLRAIIDENTSGINITEDILSMISGNLSIGGTKAVQGIYSFDGGLYDVYKTIIVCGDSLNAANAVENYKNHPRFEKPPSNTVSRFGKVTFNGHEATEVRTRSPAEDIRYGYVWSNGNLVIIVEPGTDDRQASMELARMMEY